MFTQQPKSSSSVPDQPKSNSAPSAKQPPAQGAVPLQPQVSGGSVSAMAARIAQLQQSLGNRSVRQLLTANAVSSASPGVSADAPIQRKIVVTPQAYAQGIQVSLDQLSHEDISEYLRIVVWDEYRVFVNHAKSSNKNAKEAAGALFEQAKNPKLEIVKRIEALTKLVNGINRYMQENDQIFEKDYIAPSEGEVHQRPNRHTRYATAPQNDTGYSHTSLKTGKPEEGRWGSDQKMYEQFGAEFGQQAVESLDTAPARISGNLPLMKLPWGMAKALLPRPLINLIFDIRFQLEAGAVVDERTEDEKTRKVKSPSAPGTLRSWHQDSPGVLPDNRFDNKQLANSAYSHAKTLHKHYNEKSQSGAGASIKNAATQPQGFAEYTGTGSDWEHNTKIVLDYMNKRVYLTLTHYQYWALITVNGQRQFWASGTQEHSAALGKLQKDFVSEPEVVHSAIMMSPWMEIMMPSGSIAKKKGASSQASSSNASQSGAAMMPSVSGSQQEEAYEPISKEAYDQTMEEIHTSLQGELTSAEGIAGQYYSDYPITPQQVAALQGRTLIPIIPDGDCSINAVLRSMGRTDEARVLRSDIATKARKEQVTDHGQSQQILQPGDWTQSHIMLPQLAELLDVRIEIVKQDGQSEFIGSEQASNRATIYHVDGERAGHYYGSTG